MAASGTPTVALDDPFRRKSFEALPAGGLEGRTRAMLKVEDGCVNFCAYCIIPYARGPVRSLTLAKAAAQASALAAQGYRELVLTGIEISSWGRDLPGRPPLADLVEAVCAAAPGAPGAPGHPGAPHRYPGLLPPDRRPAQPVPPLPPLPPERLRRHPGPDEPEI